MAGYSFNFVNGQGSAATGALVFPSTADARKIKWNSAGTDYHFRFSRPYPNSPYPNAAPIFKCGEDTTKGTFTKDNLLISIEPSTFKNRGFRLTLNYAAGGSTGNWSLDAGADHPLDGGTYTLSLQQP
jgi:hypothetical protein